MYIKQRRPYVSNPSSEHIPVTVQDNRETDEIGTTIIDTLQLLSKGVSELKQSIDSLRASLKDMDNRTSGLDIRHQQTENEIRNEIDSLKREMRMLKSMLDMMQVPPAKNSYISEPGYYSAGNEYDTYKPEIINKPLMPGTGFSGVTAEFLRNLGGR